ncbi:MAG: HAD family hydrolase [Anaerolineales bacterium]|nr:HAD family hydrolase [Anaerolineales bacterium]
MNTKKALFTDLDDTLYSWIDSFAPSFRAMVHVLHKKTQIEEEKLIESFRKVYNKRKTLDYSFVIQELDIWEELGWSKEKVISDAVKDARGAVSRVRSHHFALYNGVRDTLKWLKSENVFVIAYTNSPGYIAERRLKKLQIDTYIDCLAFFYDYEIPKDVPSDVQEARKSGKPKSSIRCKERFDNLKKPDPRPIYSLIEKHHLDAAKTYLIGDSIENDVYMAQQAGIFDIWAQYGTINHNPKDIETIKRISTISEQDRKRNLELREMTKPKFTVSNFAEIKDIIGSNQLSFNF